jgi:hypothetical protein
MTFKLERETLPGVSEDLGSRGIEGGGRGVGTHDSEDAAPTDSNTYNIH